MTLKHPEFNRNVLVSSGKKLLDVGCGTGRYFEWANKHGLAYTGVDVDGEVIKRAILKYRSHPQFTPESFNVVDGSSLAMFEDKSFDTILLVEVIEHIENLPALERLIKECLRIARKNILFTTPNCSDEAVLKEHKLVYNHYTHSVGKGFDFKYDDSHKHHLRFTKENLSEFLGKITSKFEVEERVPLEVVLKKYPNKILFYKLWGEIEV